MLIWGDSQAINAINLDMLKNDKDLNVYSAARSGAGIYDLFVFTEFVPESSIVIIEYSQTIFLRRIEKEYNRSGLSLSALYLVLKNNVYSFFEILRIVKKNIFHNPVKLLLTTHDTVDSFSAPDEHILNKALSKFKTIINCYPKSYQAKIDSYKECINLLIEKHCIVIIILYPYAEQIHDILAKAPTAPSFEKLLGIWSSDKNINIMDLRILNTKSEIMQDLTHVNQYGCELITNKIVAKLRDFKKPLHGQSIYINQENQ